jgi:hypothetical protein
MSSFFQIVATVYAMVAGAPADTIGSKSYFHHPFETMEECKAYLNTDEFAVHRTELAEMVVHRFGPDHVPKLTIVAACEEIKARGGDEGKI